MQPIVFEIVLLRDPNIVFMLLFIPVFIGIRTAWRSLPVVGG